MREERRGPWYLLTGLILGAALGLVYAWLISPRNYADTSPASLQAEFKDQYRAMIALAYLADGNFARAQARLDLLRDEDAIQELNAQAQRSLAEGVSPREAQALGLLAVALGQGGLPGNPGLTTQSPVASSAPTDIPPPSPTASPTGTTPTSNPATQTAPTNPPAAEVTASPDVIRTLGATGTPLPTRTPSPTPGSPFVLTDQTFICDLNVVGPLLIVLAENTAGQPLPDVEAIVNWEGGEDHFFTGLKPELGLGYADFVMAPGVVYALRLAEGGQPISDLAPAECETPRGERYWGSWVLQFNRP